MAKQTVKVIVAGAAGRMGRTILSLAHLDPEIKIAGAFEKADSPSIGRDISELIGAVPFDIPVHPDLRECVQFGNVIIDFTQPEALPYHLEIALKTRRAMVIGTTGLTQPLIQKIQSASRKIPIVQAPNMSIGVNLLFKLASLVSGTLDHRYDVEIVEEHHKHKKDAPSGTALELGRLIAKARKIDFQVNAVYGRKGLTGERKRGSIGIHAVRGGDVVGNHQVSFISEGERVELIHKASSREAFGQGALLAAKFVAKKKIGFYNMQQVLGL
ncbi:MAG: 4-hydroxy-tetrahydrodipicolinate reductase [Omnitrophica bacterium RIFCSPHIGHO2_02_FULL_46_11]|nr:MAG: 4-hydroxy-tetrahydrodipicolinate reductase [Omnitrophica bacterium RIFCSPHIGHO2_02_FULL_46_11]OGW87565.1 MAG: 4-hydroxy-tetrahydrodipicolinate reductase [Omnitrophica bacterium RIFCSPLOWO2_01_FULL_45_10b]